jgi:ribosomal protein L7/L12
LSEGRSSSDKLALQRQVIVRREIKFGQVSVTKVGICPKEVQVRKVCVTGLYDEAVENIDTELRSLISEGKRIKAVKGNKEITGLGLTVSKEYIDSLIIDDRKK